jgi:hypothetical protein
MFVELDPSHSRHLNVRDQARGCSEERRCEEIGRRWERFSGVAQRRQELHHGLAKRLIVLDDRYQSALRHRGFPAASLPHPLGAACRLALLSNSQYQ